MTKSTRKKLKRMWANVEPEIHAEIKAIAAREGIFLEDWTKQAILEKYAEYKKIIPLSHEKDAP